MFSHRDDPSRRATLKQKPDAHPPVMVVEYDDAKGKRRKKSFKNAHLGRARDAALRFLLNKEGFLIRGPQDGALRWMARILGPYMGEIRHSVAPDTGTCWVMDGNNTLMRITPESCALWQGPLDGGAASPGARPWADRGGQVWVLAPFWERIDGELILGQRLMRVQDGPEPAITELLRVQGPHHLASLHGDRQGNLLAPAPGGAALYDRSGAVQRAWTLQAQKGTIPPHGALSECGTWMVLVDGPQAQRIHLPSDAQDTLPCPFEGVNGLQITTQGEVYASGFLYPSHGLYRLEQDAPVRVSDDIRATVSADGAQVAEAQHGRLTLRDPHRDSEDPQQLNAVLNTTELPLLGMAKYGAARFGSGGQILVLSDAYTLGCVLPSS